MRLSVGALYWLSALAFGAGLGCNESCDELCMEDYRDCKADDSSDSCDAERERLRVEDPHEREGVFTHVASDLELPPIGSLSALPRGGSP